MSEPLKNDVPIILFVEDEPNMRNLVEKVFLEKGYRILTAPNGIKALEILVNTTPDLIISDIMMPEMNGIDFFHAVQERFGENRPVFMFLTAKNEEEDIVSGFSLGAEDYITKPVSIRHLASKIEARIKQIQAQKKQFSTGLRGNLQDQGVADIIQFIELAEHTGKLGIDAYHREGQIQFRDGQIFWADFSPLSGTEAVYALMALNQGTFHFESTDDVIKTNRIKVDNFALILEAMKRIDEQGRDVILRPVIEADTLFVNQEPELTPVEDPSVVDTVTAVDIPMGMLNDLPESGHSGDTQRLRAVKRMSSSDKPAKVRQPAVVPEWVESADFLQLGRSISELENGDFQGEWVEWTPPGNPVGVDFKDPVCVLITSGDHLYRVFRILSEVFLISSQSEHTLPLASTHFQDHIPFRIIGFPIEAAEFIPNDIQGLPTIFVLPSESVEDMLPFLVQIIETSQSRYRVIVSDDPDSAVAQITSVVSTDPLPGIIGSFKTWLSSLLTLEKSLKTFNQISLKS